VLAEPTAVVRACRGTAERVHVVQGAREGQADPPLTTPRAGKHLEWPGVRSASRQEGVADMPPGKGTRRVYTVETDPKGGWRSKAKGSTRAVAKGDNKAEVVKRTIEVAKKQPKAQVRIKGKNGRIQNERTYPRSSDPKTAPG
jgi:hypothetical protein